MRRSSPHWKPRLPALGAFPEDGEGWKALGTNDASDYLNLAGRIAGSQAIVFDVAEHQEKNIEREVRRQAWERGLEARNLARRLRSTHGLHHIVPVFDYANELMQARIKTEREDEEHEEKLQRKASERRRLGESIGRVMRNREIGINGAIGEAVKDGTADNPSSQSRRIRALT